MDGLYFVSWRQDHCVDSGQSISQFVLAHWIEQLQFQSGSLQNSPPCRDDFTIADLIQSIVHSSGSQISLDYLV